MVTRREFLDTIAAGAAGMAISSTAKSYGQMLGSNDRLKFIIMGLRWRGYGLAQIGIYPNAGQDAYLIGSPRSHKPRFT